MIRVSHVLMLASCLAAAISFAAPAQSQTSGRPLTAVDRGARWHDNHAWGGGAAVTLDLPEPGPRSRASFGFLGGAAPRFTFGCTSLDPARSHWRFRADFTAPGTAINNIPGAEQAYQRGTSHALGVAGQVVLRDELDNEFRRFPLRPSRDGLETASLGEADRKAFTGASFIRVETPRLVLEASAHDLGLAIAKASGRLRCGSVQ
jgi:hypothetical protein